MVSLFHQALSEPSFGTWNHYIREVIQYLQENNHSFFCPELVSYYHSIETSKKRKLYKGNIEYVDAHGDIQLKKQQATAIGMLINFRNRYLGHGLTLDEESSAKIWDKYFPIFRNLLAQMSFTIDYPMRKQEHGETYHLHSANIIAIESSTKSSSNVWIENSKGENLNILPFFVLPGELSISKKEKEEILSYESYTGKTIKFFSPEGSEKQTSGKILEYLNLLLRDKQRETPNTPEEFTKEVFKSRIKEENRLLIDTLYSEKKVIPGVYVHREEMEINLREWVGASMSIFFIAAEAGSGKTNLLVEAQRQYEEMGYHSLMIRLGRMEKQTLSAQIAYLLNIDDELDLLDYTTLAGTQDKPTILLLDGLNEVRQAKMVWQEIITLSKAYTPGSLKIVVTCRANSPADLQGYTLAGEDQDLMYGDNKDQEDGLPSYTFWLTRLNMMEMKSAWDNYVAKDKSLYRPLFSFDDIAAFDRAIYKLICNPLIMRLFLEVYHGKKLPTKKTAYLNIWKDWFESFSVEEQKFFELLAAEIWETGKNELVLDDLLKNPDIKPYLVSGIINDPYPRLKNLGWISRYTKDLNAFIGFTVEGALLYLLGRQLQEASFPIDVQYVRKLRKEGTKLQVAGLEEYLCEEAFDGDFILTTDLIDTGEELLDLCVSPLLHHLKSFGVEELLSKILSNTTTNDWKVLLMLNKSLDNLQMQILRKDLLSKTIDHITFQSKSEIELGLEAIALIDYIQAKKQFNRIDFKNELLINDDELINIAGNCETRFGRYDKALEYYEKCLDIRLINLGEQHPSVATTYNSIGSAWSSKGEYDKALEYHEKCLDIRLISLGEQHPSVATTYNSIGSAWISKGEYDKALEYCEKCLDIRLISLGEQHPSVATSYSNIGNAWSSKGEYDKALEYHEKCLDIRLISLGEQHPSVATTYSNIGSAWRMKGEYDKALEYFQQSLHILIKIHGEQHPIIAVVYSNLGSIFREKDENIKALEYYQKCLKMRLKLLDQNHPLVATIYHYMAMSYEAMGLEDKALEYFILAAEIRKDKLGNYHEKTKESKLNVKRLSNNLKSN